MKLFNSKTIAAVVLAMTACLSAFAQEFTAEYPTSTRDENGKVVKSGYITNMWYDNWVISVDGGATTYTSKVTDPKFAPAFDLSVTKWAMPAMAFRFGVQGFQGKEIIPAGYAPIWMNHSAFPWNPQKNQLSWDYFYAHADLLWSATNSFLGYKFDRFWNIAPYLHGGYQRMFDPEKYKTNYDREVVYGAGILNTFRITDRINLNIDLRASNFSGRYHSASGGRVTELTAMAGLSFNIFKPGWRRVHELEKANAAALAANAAALAAEQANSKNLADLNDALRAQNDALLDEMNGLKKLANEASNRYGDDELLRRIAEAGLVIYYDLGKDVIRDCEELHINQYVQAALAADPNHVFYLTGSADKGTGTTEINNRLSNGRVNNVKRYLINDLKIAPEKVVIKKTIISDQHADGRLDRCVLFENE